MIGSRIMQAIRARFAPARRADEAKAKAMVRVLFVCMGNICRSPMAEGVFRRMLEGVGLNEKIYVDSAGTHSYHIGAPPDSRGQATALRRGVDLRGIRARRVVEADLIEFDYVLAMDRDNFDHLQALCEEESQLKSRLHLFLDFAPDLPEREVPDPYYGGPMGFERVMDLIEEAAQGLLVHIRKRYRI
jgi:protein-tyrosine phosphatase